MVMGLFYLRFLFRLPALFRNGSSSAGPWPSAHPSAKGMLESTSRAATASRIMIACQLEEFGEMAGVVISSAVARASSRNAGRR
jgi:hypothetical protein